MCDFSNNTGFKNTGHGNTGDWNAGARNAGEWNSGNENTGNRNTGSRNTGDWNSGNQNTGDWNSGDKNTGFFNTVMPVNILSFNKKTTIYEWDSCKKPSFIYFAKDWQNAVRRVTKRDIELLIKLPNFEESVFKEISGYDLKDLHKYEILFRKY